MNNEIKEMWNNRYGAKEFAYGKEPNEFFKQTVTRYKLAGNLLLPAEGEGRNAVFAAEQGLQVTAFDISEEGKKKALQLAASQGVMLDYKVGDFLSMDFNETSFDGAALIYAHFPPAILSNYHQRIGELIKPGGLLILEGFSTNNLPLREKNPEIGGPNKLEMLFTTESIQKDFPEFEVLQLEEKEVELNEGIYHKGIGKVIRFVGKKKG